MKFTKERQKCNGCIFHSNINRMIGGEQFIHKCTAREYSMFHTEERIIEPSKDESGIVEYSSKHYELYWKDKWFCRKKHESMITWLMSMTAIILSTLALILQAIDVL